MSKLPLIVTLDYPPEQGGIARYLGELVRASEEPVEVYVPIPHETTGPGAVSQQQMFRTKWPWWLPMIKLCRSAKSRTSCLIISHVLPLGTAAMLSRWTGGPSYILVCHGLDIRLATRTLWKRHLLMFMMWTAKAVVSNSQSTAEYLRKTIGITSHVITPAVQDIQLPERADARRRLGIRDDEQVVLAVARLVDRKGIDVLIDAVKKLPPNDRVKLVIIGNGIEQQKLKKQAIGSPHEIKFINDASDEHLHEWYAASNVFCLPVRETPDDVEGFGIVFLEAALASLPVIAGNNGGVREAVVDGETGMLVEPNADNVARALMLVLGDRELQNRLGRAGRERALRDFRWVDRWKAFKAIVDR